MLFVYEGAVICFAALLSGFNVYLLPLFFASTMIASGKSGQRRVCPWFCPFFLAGLKYGLSDFRLLAYLANAVGVPFVAHPSFSPHKSVLSHSSGLNP